MASGIRKTEKGGKAIYMEAGVFYNEKTGDIHITVPSTNWFHTTVNNKDGSKRSHPNLYSKLARALKEAGVPYPDGVVDTPEE